MKINSAFSLLVSVSFMVGCSTTPKYACGTPEDGKCQSVGDAYMNALGKKIKHTFTKGSKRTAVSDSDIATSYDVSPKVTQYVPEGVAILSQPQVMRVWVAPWEDAQGVFHDQSYQYTVVDSGQWTLRANTEKSIYPSPYMRLEHPTEKVPESTLLKPPAAKPSMTTAQAEAAAQDLVSER